MYRLILMKNRTRITTRSCIVVGVPPFIVIVVVVLGLVHCLALTDKVLDLSFDLLLQAWVEVIGGTMNSVVVVVAFIPQTKEVGRVSRYIIDQTIRGDSWYSWLTNFTFDSHRGATIQTLSWSTH
jgi:hypothetical protein